MWLRFTTKIFGRRKNQQHDFQNTISRSDQSGDNKKSLSQLQWQLITIDRTWPYSLYKPFPSICSPFPFQFRLAHYGPIWCICLTQLWPNLVRKSYNFFSITSKVSEGFWCFLVIMFQFGQVCLCIELLLSLKSKLIWIGSDFVIAVEDWNRSLLQSRSLPHIVPSNRKGIPFFFFLLLLLLPLYQIDSLAIHCSNYV